jgi:hypothetical protein
MDDSIFNNISVQKKVYECSKEKKLGICEHEVNVIKEILHYVKCK